MDDLLADTADRSQVKTGHTGGSTGKPLAFYYDDAKHELMRAGMMRSYRLSGWRPGQKILNFWGARQDVVPGGVFSASLSTSSLPSTRSLLMNTPKPNSSNGRASSSLTGRCCCRATRRY